jgi:hypothetical protein
MQPATLIDRWAAVRGLPMSRTASVSRLTFTVDDRFRLHVSEARNQGVALESRICDLPSDELDRDRLVERVMLMSVGRMRTDDAMLAVDPLEGTLLLQSAVSADAGERGLSEAVGRFVNSLAFWRSVVR